MKKIEIKNRFSGDVIFTHKCENNTMKNTIEEAVKQGANLVGANLVGANLEGANLEGANLGGAYLEGANLGGAYLGGANLGGVYIEGAYLGGAYIEGANLRNANLGNAYLGGANLGGAYIEGAYLGGAYIEGANLGGAKNLDKVIKIPMYCKWTHGITNGNLIHIGCEKRTIKEWDLFFESDEIITTKRNTEDFKQIQAIFEGYKAYLNFLNK